MIFSPFCSITSSIEGDSHETSGCTFPVALPVNCLLLFLRGDTSVNTSDYLFSPTLSCEDGA